MLKPVYKAIFFAASLGCIYSACVVRNNDTRQLSFDPTRADPSIRSFPWNQYQPFTSDWLLPPYSNGSDQRPTRYSDNENQRHAHLLNAEVLAADYDLLQKDFPELQNLSNRERDLWLLLHGAVITVPQLKHFENESPSSRFVQTKPNIAFLNKETHAEQRTVCRKLKSCAQLEDLVGDAIPSHSNPYGYNRAAVLTAGVLNLQKAINSQLSELTEEQLSEAQWLYLDAKGVGLAYGEPKHGDHSNGLLPLAEALREYVHSQLVAQVLAYAKQNLLFEQSSQMGDCGLVVSESHRNPLQSYLLEACKFVRQRHPNKNLDFRHLPYSVIAAYAVLDAGFEIIEADGSREPAGILLRQAHLRKNPSFLDPEFETRGRLEAALVLRAYGITMDNMGFVTRQEMDQDGRLVDFGTLLVHGKKIQFQTPLIYAESDLHFRDGVRFALNADELPPLEKLAVDAKEFGFKRNEPSCRPEGDPRCDFIRKWADYEVQQWRSGSDKANRRVLVLNELKRRLQGALPSH